jgi:hypothetical protein
MRKKGQTTAWNNCSQLCVRAARVGVKTNQWRWNPYNISVFVFRNLMYLDLKTEILGRKDHKTSGFQIMEYKTN